jgi:phage tail-like protein
MSLDRDQIKASYPLPVYNYRVTVGDSAMGFSEVSGLNMEYEAVTYKHGLSFTMGANIIPGARQPIRVTMKRGIVKGNDFLSGWVREAYANPSASAKKDILVDLCDEEGKPVVRWKVRGALPVKLNGPAFDARSNEVAIETLELVAHEIQVDYHPD